MKYHPRPNVEHNPKKNLGLVHVYTGDGKGKTTAALGLSLRAIGHGHRVLIIRFLRGYKDTGEMKALANMPNADIEILPFAQEESVNFENPLPVDRYLVERAMDYTRAAMIKNRPDLLVLDEVNPTIHYGLLNIKEVLDFLDSRHRQTEVVLTGNHAHPDLLNYADLVTVMHGTKHYYNNDSFEPRFGIEH